MSVAVIGVGYWGPNLVRNFLSLNEDVIIFDRDKNRLNEVAALFEKCRVAETINHILEDDNVEAVAIAVPLDEHHKLVTRCLDAGKNVFIEKPLCKSIEESDDIKSRLNGSTLMVGHITSFSPGINKMIKMINDGKIGEVKNIDLRRTHLGPIYLQTDVLTEVAAHDLAILLLMSQELPSTIQAWGIKRLGNGSPDLASIVLNWENGRYARIDVQWTSALRKREAIIEGTNGTLFFAANTGKEELTWYQQEDSFECLRNKKSQKEVNESLKTISVELENKEPLRDELEEFLAAMRSKREPLNNYDFGRKVVVMLEAARLSMAENNREIKLSW